MSFNIRYDNPRDGINSWDNRKDLIFPFLKEHKPDIIGFQEVLKNQYEQLQYELDDYNFVGAGREDGNSEGEFVPIFYLKEKYELLASSHFWLSENPEIIGSKSWGAALPRIVTWLQLKDQQNGYIFYVFNTHFSHVSSYARNKSALLLLNKIKTIAGEAPVILTGDFNAQPSEQMYTTLTENWTGYYPMWDSRNLSVPKANVNFQTFNGFKPETTDIVIDHIFVNGFFDVSAFTTFQIRKEDMFISDHYPLMAELSFRLQKRTKQTPRKKLMQSIASPQIVSKQIVFTDSLLVTIKPQGHHARIYYTLDGTEPDTSSLQYQKSLVLKQTGTLKARAFSPGMYPSKSVQKTFIRKGKKSPKLVDVTPKSDVEYSSPNYSALSDGLSGNHEHLKNGRWVGFNGTDVDFTYDFKRKTKLSTCHISTLSMPNKWIISPSKIEVKVSDDGINYRRIAHTTITPSFDTGKTEQHVHSLALKGYARYVKLSVFNGGLLPVSHNGHGNPSWMFIDEIVVQ